MKTYAMICNDRIIEVVHDCPEKPNWPPDTYGNPVFAVECDPEATRDWTYEPTTQLVYDATPTNGNGENTPLSDFDELAIDTALNVEYIACMLELML